MPRTCLACSSPNRKAIDAALASGEALRSIAKRVSISDTALFRHKAHVAGAIVKASERREESIGESILARLEKLYQRGERILDDAERSGDGRLALQAIRETREVLAGVFALANKAAASGNGLAQFTSDDLKAELSRRGEQLEIILTTVNIGSQTPRATPESPRDTPLRREAPASRSVL